MESNREDGGRRKRNSFLPPLLLVLMAAFVVSSGMLGFTLGRNASGGTGELIDTIVLSPGDVGEGEKEEIVHFMSGRVLLRDDTPCAGVTVSLKNTGKSDITDERGKFFISDVSSGSELMEVHDGQGNLLAGTGITLQFKQGAQARAQLTDKGEPSLELPADARMLEFTFVMDSEESSLSLHEESGYVVTTGGKVVNFSGKMLQLEEESFSVLPGGDIAQGSGYTLLPSKAIMISPTGSSAMEFPDSSGKLQESTVVYSPEDGSVELGNVSVQAGGTVVFPGGQETLGPTENVIIVENGEGQELPELPEEYVPEVPGENDGSASSSEGNSQDGETISSQPSEESSIPQPDEPEGNDIIEESDGSEASVPTFTPEPSDPLGISDLTTGVSWKQQSIIDLFKNRTSGQDLGEENGIAVIAPGSAGNYEFQLKNDGDYDIRFTIQISEQSFHLPILYSITDLENGRVYMGGGRVGEDGSTISTKYIMLSANTSRRYRLGWEWQYEDWLTPWEDDALDISAAAGEDRTYIVSLGVAAEQIVKINNYTDTAKAGVTKY